MIHISVFLMIEYEEPSYMPLRILAEFDLFLFLVMRDLRAAA